MMDDTHICTAARAMAQTYSTGAVPLYGKKLRLPDRQAVILLIKDIRRLIFPAYYGGSGSHEPCAGGLRRPAFGAH